MALKKLVAGNWKMHGLSSDLAEIKAIADASKQYRQVDVALCVPAILIERASRAVPGFAIGGQDVHFADKGAYTGCISAEMLLDAGASLKIVGKYERLEAQRQRLADMK
jgi:triosephosphate isomerase